MFNQKHPMELDYPVRGDRRGNSEIFVENGVEFTYANYGCGVWIGYGYVNGHLVLKQRGKDLYGKFTSPVKNRSYPPTQSYYKPMNVMIEDFSFLPYDTSLAG